MLPQQKTKQPLLKKPRSRLRRILFGDMPLWKSLARIAALTGLTYAATIFLPVRLAPSRPLSPGEEALLRPVFQDAIDYSKIRIHTSRIADVRLQATNALAGAQGNLLYVRSNIYSDDLSKGDKWQKYFFMHEAAHIWQRQNCVRFMFRDMIEGSFKSAVSPSATERFYSYDLTERKNLHQYNIEQQASIIADAFAPIEDFSVSAKPLRREDSDRVLRNFRANPGYARGQCLKIF